ncbi:MAG TPA: acyl-CoA dehydrogenase family protein [Sporichthya sp.]|nr:acyl-CoA dehydrogenase family protein [Sporichthya sp.]
MRRSVFHDRHETYRKHVRAFLTDEVVPGYAEWEKAGAPPWGFWSRAGAAGILGVGIPVEYGGNPETTFLHSAVFAEEAQALGLAISGVWVQVDICAPYFLAYCTPEQKQRWLPRIASGDALTAIAMSEPGVGSDLKSMVTGARRHGDRYVVNGSKTFISNGRNANLIVLAVKTDRDAGRDGISLLVIEDGMRGFTRGRALEKMGQKAQDLAELFFDDVEVPVGNRLGEENNGFAYLTANLAQERLSIAVNSQAAAVAALSATLDAVRASTQKPGQHTKFELAACHTDVAAGQALVDQALVAHESGELSAADASMVKLFATELQGRVVDRCVQVLGEQGIRKDSPLGRAYADARVARIFGGSSEIMKVIVSQSLGI